MKINRRHLFRGGLLAAVAALVIGGAAVVRAGGPKGFDYFGFTSSSIHPEFTFVEAGFTINAVRGRQFRGQFLDGDLLFNITGGITPAGAATFTGTFNSLRITGRGQFSADGATFIGSAEERGTLGGGFFRDNVTFCFLNAEAKGGGDAPKATVKSKR